ncbi:MAG: hypothetical protein F7B61_07030 [Caldisphaeraceae archaeon]|nr:hypothetical protein [Caldisphaeraceae archaeon]
MPEPENSIKVIEIEGLAMNGLIKEYNIIQCEKPKGYKKVHIVTTDGEEMETACIEPDAVQRLVLVINMYVKKWSKYINKGEALQG